jgi:hypothetical protein
MGRSGTIVRAPEEGSRSERRGRGVIFLRMRTPPIPIPNTFTPVVLCIVYTNSVAGVDACFVQESSVAIHAHPTPSPRYWLYSTVVSWTEVAQDGIQGWAFGTRVTEFQENREFCDKVDNHRFVSFFMFTVICSRSIK